MDKSGKITIYTDGASRGNPGPAAAGYILSDSEGNTILAKGDFLGEKTNNFAEYTGIIKALESAQNLKARNIEIFSDSELLVKQLTGKYRVKSENLKPLFNQVTALLESFENWKIKHVRREKNKKADELANRCLDSGKDIEEKPLPLFSDSRDNSPQSKPVRLGILLSGGGRTMMNLYEQIRKSKLNAEICTVISSRSKVAGVEKAKRNNLNLKIIRRKDFSDTETFSEKIKEELTAANVELVVQAGWLCYWKIPREFENKVMNIHPALLPSFGGKGMWGHHVHEAVLERGCKLSGCTVHFCNNEYDKGPIIIQRACKVKDDDSPDDLADRVFKEECKAYPEAIRLFGQNKLIIQNGKVKTKS
jgi:formyltetrahydrofolate-dependent phosphoribosylglycinamide formyltransferase